MANRQEMVEILAYLVAGSGTRQKVTADQSEVYFDLLGDLPADALRAAARQALIEHVYPTLPPVGRLRQLATDIVSPPGPDPDQAWGLALGAVQAHGEYGERKGLAGLPGSVAAALSSFGWRSLCNCTDDGLPTARAQFLKLYDARRGRERREALTPPNVRALVAGVANALTAREGGGLRAVP